MLNIIQQKIDDNHQDVLWYGGRIATAEYQGYTFILGAYGDVYATLYDSGGNEMCDVRDKNNAGRFYDEMNRLIPDDKTLYSLIDTERLVLDNNNWFEVLIDGPDGDEYDFGWITETSNYDEALQEMLDNMKATVEDIESTK